MHIIALLLQKEGRRAGLYEVAGAELVDQDVIQAVAVAFIRQLYCLLQGRKCSYAWADLFFASPKAGVTRWQGRIFCKAEAGLWAQDEHNASLSSNAQIS